MIASRPVRSWRTWPPPTWIANSIGMRACRRGARAGSIDPRGGVYFPPGFPHRWPVSASEEFVLGVTADERELDEWALVLASEGIVYRLEETPAAWRLLVAPRDAARAQAVLDAYGRDEERRPPAPTPVPEYGPTRVGVVLAVGLVAFAVLAGSRGAGGPWVRAGSAMAGRIQDGEVWRAVTALTLHANAAHLVGNLAGTVVFVSAVGFTLGPGAAAFLVLLAGVGGNLANAFLRTREHDSIGASTAVFGAIGILGGLAAVRGRRARRPWVPIAGSLALLAMLGTEKNADLGAHVLGLACGVVLGLLVGAGTSRVAPAPVQWALGLATCVVVAISWIVALG